MRSRLLDGVRARARRANIALALAACLAASQARADPLQDIDRVLRRSSPPGSSSEGQGERHEGPQVDHASSRFETPSETKAAPRACEGAEELRHQVRELRETLDRLAAAEPKPPPPPKGRRPPTREAKPRAPEREEKEHERTSRQRPPEESSELRQAAQQFCAKVAGKSRPGGGSGLEEEGKGKQKKEEQGRRPEKKERAEGKKEKKKAGKQEPHQAREHHELDRLYGQLDRLERDVEQLQKENPPDDHRRAEGERGSAEPRERESSRQARRGLAAHERAERAPAQSASALEGKVAASAERQIVVRADDGNLLLFQVGDETVIHERDERLEPDALMRGTPVHVRYRPGPGSELRADDVRVLEKK